MKIKDRLKELRLKANLTQEELANQIYVSRTLVSKWESGDRYPSPENLMRLAVLFQIPQEELIGSQEEKKKYNINQKISIAYTCVCCVVVLGLLVVLGVAVVERIMLQNAWTAIGGLVFNLVYVLPVILVLVLFEVLTLRKKNGYKMQELYSLLAAILVWLVSMAIYLLMG